jgi:hypothetical protein
MVLLCILRVLVSLWLHFSSGFLSPQLMALVGHRSTAPIKGMAADQPQFLTE